MTIALVQWTRKLSREMTKNKVKVQRMIYKRMSVNSRQQPSRTSHKNKDTTRTAPNHKYIKSKTIGDRAALSRHTWPTMRARRHISKNRRRH